MGVQKENRTGRYHQVQGENSKRTAIEPDTSLQWGVDGCCTAYSALLHDEQVYAVCRANTEMEYHLQINAKAENGQFACSRILAMTTVYTSFPGYDQRLTHYPDYDQRINGSTFILLELE